MECLGDDFRETNTCWCVCVSCFFPVNLLPVTVVLRSLVSMGYSVVTADFHGVSQ